MPFPVPTVNPSDQTFDDRKSIGQSVDLAERARYIQMPSVTGASEDFDNSAYPLNTKYDEFATNYKQSFVVTASDTIYVVPSVVLVDASAGNITLTIPSPTMAEGRTMTIQRVDSTANTITITPQDGNVRITSTASSNLSNQWGCIDLTAVNNGSYVIWVGR